jgi:hypothetical protein
MAIYCSTSQYKAVFAQKKSDTVKTLIKYRKNYNPDN